MKKIICTLLCVIAANGFGATFGPRQTGHRQNDISVNNYAQVLTGTYMRFGEMRNDPSAYTRTYLRFPDIQVPKNATITSAILSVTTFSGTLTATPSAMIISYENVANPDTFPTGLSALNARFNTYKSDTTMYFVLPNNGTPPNTKTFEIGPLVQRCVNMSLWNSGNAIALFEEDSASTAYRDYYTWEGDSAVGGKAPYITITYTGGGGPAASPGVAIRKNVTLEKGTVLRGK